MADAVGFKTSRRMSPIRSRPGAPSRASTSRSRRAQAGAANEVDGLQQQCETYTKRIEMEKRRGEELDKKLAITRKKITDTRSRMQGYDDVAAARRREKDLKAAEYRLQHEKQRLSSQVATNRKLKADVESLRRDRMQRLGIIDKLDAQVESARSDYENSTLELRSEAEARDAAQRDIQAIQRALKEEVGEFERDFEERIAKASEDVAAPTRLDQMERHAVQSESEALLLHLGSAEGHHGTLSIMQERSLKHKSTRTLWEVAKREVEVAEQREALVEFEDAFAAIKEGTSIRTIDEMVSAFSEAEDASYSLVTMINEGNRELEAEEVALGDVRRRTREVIDGTADDEERLALEAIAAGDDGEEDGAGGSSGAHGGARPDSSVEELERRAGVYDAQYEAGVRLLDRIKPGVHSLFQKVGAADEAAMESLAATGVSDSNILVFLGVVEGRIAEIVRLQRGLGIAAPPLPVAAFSPRAVAAAVSGGAAGGAGRPLAGSQSVGDGRVGHDSATFRAVDLGSPAGRSASVAALSTAVMPSGPAVHKPEPPSMGDAALARPAPVAPAEPAPPLSMSASVASHARHGGGPRASRARLTASESFRAKAGSRTGHGDGDGGRQTAQRAALHEAAKAEQPLGGKGAPISGQVLDVSTLKQQLGLAPRAPRAPSGAALRF